jgi:hypothetical protein
MSTKTQTVIDLVRVKSWYMPGNAESYQALKAAAGPLLIFHKDFLPTLQLATRRSGIRAREKLWTDLFNERMDKIGSQWKSAKDRNCKITNQKLVFLCKATSKNRKAVAALESALAKFFARWSFRYRPVFSETADRFKLVIDFRFDPELQPLMPVVPVDVKRSYELVMGFSKISLTFYDKPSEDVKVRGMIAPLVLLEVFTQTGSTWYPVHTSTFKPSQIGNVATFAPGFAELINRMHANEAHSD